MSWKILLLENNIKITMPAIDNCFTLIVFYNLRHTYLLEVGLTQIPALHAPLFITCHAELHVDFSSTDFFFGPLDLHLLVESELGQCPPFQRMRALSFHDYL